jgi:preprotein translocase subunit YajC
MQGQQAWFTAVLWMGIIVLMYVLLIHPQRKKEKEHDRLVESLQPGDRVVTNGGIHGTITRVEDAVVTVQVADNVRIKVTRAAIGRRLGEEEEGGGGKK